MKTIQPLSGVHGRMPDCLLPERGHASAPAPAQLACARLTTRRRSRRWALLILAGLPGLAGCTTIDDDSGLQAVQSLVAERVPQRVAWDRGRPEDAQAAQLVSDLLRNELTLDAAVQIALLRNAGLQSTFEDLGISQADLVQAGLLSNPFLDFELRFPGDPHRPLEVHLIQDVMSIFTRSLRERVAAAGFEAAQLRVANAVIDLAADVRAAFFEVQAAEQTVELRQSVVVATGASADVARRLREAGNVTELEYETEAVAEGAARLDLLQAEADLVQRREALSALMGLWGDDTQWTVAQRLPELPDRELTPEGLQELALSQRLDLTLAAREIEAAAAVLDLTDTTALIPSLEVGVHLEREPQGDTTTGPSIGLPVPLFDQGQARRSRDEALLRRSQQEYVALAVRIRSEVRAQQARLMAARARANYLGAVVLPLRDRIVQQTQLHYNAMQLGVFELLMARSAEIDAGRQSVEALRDYWLARTALERAVGGSLASVPTTAVESALMAPPAIGLSSDAPDQQPAESAPMPMPMPMHQHGDHP